MRTGQESEDIKLAVVLQNGSSILNHGALSYAARL